MPKRLSGSNQRRAVLTAGGEVRGPVVKVDPGICPDCGHHGKVSPRGVRYRHKTPSGRECPGGGIRVVLLPVDLDLNDLPPIQHWQLNPDGSPKVRNGPRAAQGHYSEPCGGCGQAGQLNPATGQLRRHRLGRDDPGSPWCGWRPQTREGNRT